jgi:hypothetical protein
MNQIWVGLKDVLLTGEFVVRSPPPESVPRDFHRRPRLIREISRQLIRVIGVIGGYMRPDPR